MTSENIKNKVDGQNLKLNTDPQMRETAIFVLADSMGILIMDMAVLNVPTSQKHLQNISLHTLLSPVFAKINILQKISISYIIIIFINLILCSLIISTFS